MRLTGGDLLAQLVQSFAMDENGTVYSLSDGAGPGNYVMFRSSSALLLDAPEPPQVLTDHFCLEPPSPDFIFEAAGLNGPAILNRRVVVEPIVESIGEAHDWPNIGRARVHHCHYKCTIYYSTELNGDAQAVIYIDHDHMIAAGQPQNGQVSLVSEADQGMAAPTSLSTASISTSMLPEASRSDTVRALWTGPDGTIYKLGGDYNGYHQVGQPPAPLVLWRLPPGRNWEPLLRVFAAEVAPDNTLFVLNMNHELQRLVPGASEWTTVASGIQSFTMTKGGTVYALDDSGKLIRVQHTRHSEEWLSSTLDTGVRSFSVTANGFLYELNSRNELRWYTGIGRKFVRIATGVTSLQQAADGTIYSLNQSGQLKRWERFGRWSIVGAGIQSFQLDPDGVLYALNSRHELKRLTAGGHWNLVDVDVQSFVVVSNGLRNVYTLTTHQELKRLEAGYSWSTLRTDATSLSIDSEGIVTARDTQGRSWMYWSPFTAPALDLVEAENAPLYCLDPPSRADVLRLTHIPDGPDVEVIVEPIVDTVDPPRWFANLGNIPAVRLHHCHHQCTVKYTDANGLQTVVIDIDDDHFIRYAGPGTPNQ